MNTRSLKFQLIAWYAAVLTGCFALLGVVTYIALERSLVGALRDNQLRRARQLAQLVREEIQNQQLGRVGQEVDVRYAPAINDRFVRITQRDGVTLYLSPAPTTQSFDPAVVPPPLWPRQQESSRQTPLLGRRKLLLTAHTLQMPGGSSFLIETGVPMDEVQAELRKWLLFLLTMVPVVLLIALGGGFVLVKRALLPVDRIAATAER